MGYRTVLREAQRDFPLSRRALWDALANTDHLDRWIGMPPVAFGSLMVTADAVYREAAARLGGLLRLRWHEYPFEWVREERYAVVRLFETGPFNVFYGGIEIRGDEQASRLRVFSELTPRTTLGWLAARTMVSRGMREVLAYCDRLAAIRSSGLDIRLPPPRRTTPADRPLLERLTAAWRCEGLSEPVVARLAGHLAMAADAEVLRMQPFGLADAWGAERSEVLRLFIRAERQGALYHTWEVMCPNCRVATARATRLDGIPERFHCDGCGIAYDTDLERWVELRYSVHTSVRAAKDEVYCIGGPANTPHIWSQHYLLPDTERVFSLVLPDETFRVRALRLNRTCPLEPEAAAGAEATFTYRPDGWFQMRQAFRPGPVTVRLRNQAPHVVVAVLERVQSDHRAITAAQVSRLPEFRDVARLESPPADDEDSGVVAVGRSHSVAGEASDDGTRVGT